MSIIILASAGSRDGPQALFPWRNTPLVEVVIDRVSRQAGAYQAGARQAGARMLVVIGADSDRVLSEARIDCETLVDSDWAEGPGAALRTALDFLARERDPGPAVVFDIGQPMTPMAVVPALLDAHGGGVTVPLYKYEIGFPLVIDRARWDWFMGRTNPPLELLAAHPEWVTPIRFDSPPPARVRNMADAAALTP